MSFQELPAISIITVCYNSKNTLARTIQSVIAQHYPFLEYIIVDGGSKDGTVEIIREFDEHISKWVSEPDQGIYDAMNKGIRMSSGEIIGILNSDDYYEPDVLRMVAETFTRNQHTDLLCGSIRFFSPDDSMAFTKKPLARVAEDHIYGRMPVCHPATFVRRQTYEELGLFDTQYKYAADYEFIMRCIRNNKIFASMDQVLTNMSAGGASSNFTSTFNETRLISIRYGCSRSLAWYRFAESCLKTVTVNAALKSRLLKKVYEAYKQRRPYM